MMQQEKPGQEVNGHEMYGQRKLQIQEKIHLREKLVVRQNGKYRRYYRETYKNGNIVYKSISSKAKEEIHEIAMKQLEYYKLKHLQYIYRLLNAFIDDYEAANRIYEEESRILLEIVHDINFEKREKEGIVQTWQMQHYHQNPYRPENLKCKTLCGIFVRSKSEAMIADALYRYGIPFRYECELVLEDGTTIYPDFTLQTVGRDGIPLLKYWEHFGLMDQHEYRDKTFEKMKEYGNNGIYPDIQLITTYETVQNPLSADYIEKIIQMYVLEEW